MGDLEGDDGRDPGDLAAVALLLSSIVDADDEDENEAASAPRPTSEPKSVSPAFALTLLLEHVTKPGASALRLISSAGTR